MKVIETKKRSIAKAASYRAIGTLLTSSIAFYVTKTLTFAFGIALLDVVAKVIFYYCHERIWNSFQWERGAQPSGVIWFTGLSGAGKTTLAAMLNQHFLTKGYNVELLDGDEVRKELKNQGFSKQDRLKHLEFMGFTASKLAKQGSLVICSFITPYEESRKHLRSICPGYIEVWIDTPLEICEQRDVKGLYAKSRSGTITNFTGVSDVFEKPEGFDIRVETLDDVEVTFHFVKEEISKRMKILTQKA